MSTKRPILRLGPPVDLFAASPVVERGPDGLPTAFRLLHPGANRSWEHGVWCTYDLTERDLDAIAGVAAQLRPVPLDCNHLSHLIANALGVTETELCRLAPLLGEKLAAGWVRIVRRPDGIWAEVDRLHPRASEFLTQDMVRYYSPVVRGAKTGTNLWISSVALTNSPALTDVEALVASALAGSGDEPPMEHGMNPKLLAVLAKLLGVAPDSLPADGNLPDAQVATLAAAVDKMAAPRPLDAAVCSALKLHTAATPAEALAAIKALGDGTVALSAVQTELTSLKRELSDTAKAKLIEQGLADGKLTQAMLAWATAQDAAVLSAYLGVAPKLVMIGKAVAKGSLTTADAPAVSAALAQVTAACGSDPKAVLACPLNHQD